MLGTKLIKDHHLWTNSKIKNISGNITLDIAGDIILDANSGVTKFYLAGSTSDYASLTVASNGVTTLATVDFGPGSAGHLTLDVDGDVVLDPYSGITKFYKNGDTDDYLSITVGLGGIATIATTDSDGSAAHLTLDVNGNINLDADTGIFNFYDAGDTADYCSLTVVGGTGATTLATTSAGSDGDITLDSSKAVILDAANTNSGAGIQFLKAGTRIGVFEAHHGYSALFLYENEGASTDDAFAIQCSEHGATTIVTVDSAAANAHLTIKADGHVEFDGCGVGFDLVTPTYNATDTDVDFTTGNKQFVTFGSGNIADLNLKFPIVSGNFVLLLKQDGTGSRTVDADGWLAFDSAGNAANGSSTVKFAGGSNPTLTTDANHVDIISFFWDADNEIAYGVASLDFQF